MPSRFAMGALLVLGTLCAHAGETPPTDVRITNAWMRLLPPPLPCAGYLTIENDSDHEVTLTDAATDAFARVQLHESYTSPAGNSRMRRVRQVRIPARHVVQLAPGGFHLMLMDARRPLRVGDHPDLVLTFAEGWRIEVKMIVRPADFTDAVAAKPAP